MAIDYSTLSEEELQDIVDSKPKTYEASDYHFGGLHPDVKQRWESMALDYFNATGEPLRMQSGYRSTEHQARLYAKDPTSGYVAPPGNSTHEQGLAIDLDRAQVPKLEKLGLIDKYFNRPLMGQTASGIKEPWHIEHPEARTNPIFATRAEQKAEKVAAKVPLDYTKMTDEELQQIAGQGSTNQNIDYSKMTNEELTAIASSAPSEIYRKYQEAGKGQSILDQQMLSTPAESTRKKGIGESAKGVLMDTLEIANAPFYPLEKLKELTVSGLEKVGGPFAPIKAPLLTGEFANVVPDNNAERDAFLQRYPQFDSLVPPSTNPDVEYNLAKTLPEVAMLLALPRYGKMLGEGISATEKLLPMLHKELPAGEIISALAGRVPRTTVGETVSPMADLADIGASESRVMKNLMNLRGASPEQPLPSWARAGLRPQYGEGFGSVGLEAELGQVENVKQYLLDKMSVSPEMVGEYSMPLSIRPTPPEIPPVVIPPKTPIVNQAILQGLGVPTRTPPPNELLEAALGRGDQPASRTLEGLTKVGIAGAGAVGTGAILSPQESQAGVPPNLIAAVGELAGMGVESGKPLIEAVTNLAAKHGVEGTKLFQTYNIYKNSGGLEELLKGLPEGFAKVGEAAALSGKVAIPVSPGSPTMPVPPVTPYPTTVAEFADSIVGIKKPGKGIFEIPDNLTVPQIDPVAPKLTRDMSRFDLERSPNIVSSNHLGAENNLVGDYAQGAINFQNTTPTVSRIFSNIVGKLGLQKDIKASEKEVKEVLGPLFSEWQGVVKPEIQIASQLKTEKEYLAKLGSNTTEAAESALRVVDLEAALKDAKIQTQGVLADIYNRRGLAIEQLGAKYANVRIKAAAEGEDWAKALVTPEEQLAVDQTRKYLDITASRMNQQGMKTLQDPNKSYVPYIFQTGEYGDTGGVPFAERLWYGSKNKPTTEWLDFIARTPGSKDWFPLWHQSMESYIPAVERKLAFNPFLRKWTPEINEWRATDMRNAAEWGAGFINRNMSGESSNMLAQGLDKLTNLEYFHYLAGSLSTAFLHLFKSLQTPMWHGFTPTLKAVGSMARVLGDTPERAIYNNFIQARLLTKALTQAPGMNTFLEPAWWQGVVGKALNSPILNPTRITEAWDRGLNTFATIHSGIKAGAQASTINRAVLESTMLLNFQGFSMPRTMTAPGMRLLTQFQGTPLKLVENKIDLIMKALTRSTDIYGRSDYNKLIRFLVLTGLTVSAGEGMGFDLFKHAGLHIPFTSETAKGDLTLAASPIIKNMATIATEGPEAGLKQVFSYWGPVQKHLEDYIPQKYGESKVQQILGVPNEGWQEEGRQAREIQEMKSARSKMRKGLKSSGRMGSPHDFLLGLLGGD
jgi:hypothetical protein